MTYFVEGIQGSGKSTLVKLLSEKCPDHKVIEEGDYSPVELAWCAYMGVEDYQAVIEKYPSLKPEIEAKTHFEDDHAVVCYTKIRTDDRGFYQALERYEIYNNRVSFERFKEIVLKRYGSWDGAPLITECALFQNMCFNSYHIRNIYLSISICITCYYDCVSFSYFAIIHNT
jgi:hypothetical protein